MAKAKVQDFENEEYYQVPKWVLKIKGLQPADIMIYMLARNNWKLSRKNGYMTSNNEVYFFLTHESLKETFDFGKNQIIASLKRLVKSGILIPEKEKGKATKFFIENDISNINFDISSLKKGSTQNKTTLVTENRLHQSEKDDYHQSEKSDISKKELNKTKVSKKEVNNIAEQLESENISFELKEKIKEFISYRKEIKKPIQTYTVVSTMLKQIGTKYTDENHLILSIDDSIANQYQGVFPIKTFNRPIQKETPAMRMLKAMKGGVENDRY